MRYLRKAHCLRLEQAEELESLGFEWDRSVEYDLDVFKLIHYILTGLVAVSVCGHIIDPWFAVVVGLFAVVGYELGVRFEDKVEIKDPVRAFAVHCMGGIVGAVCCPFALLFDDVNSRFLLFYGRSSTGVTFFSQFGCQIVGLLAILLWTALVMGVVYGLAWKVNLLAWSQSSMLQWARKFQVSGTRITDIARQRMSSYEHVHPPYEQL